MLKLNKEPRVKGVFAALIVKEEDEKRKRQVRSSTARGFLAFRPSANLFHMARTLGNSRARTPLGEIQPTLFNAFLFFPVRHGCYTPRLGWIHDEPCFHETRGILNITRMRVEKSLIMVLKCARTGFTKDHWGSLRQRASPIYGRGTASIYANTKDFLPFSLIDVCFTWPAPNSFNRRAGRNKFHVRLFFSFPFLSFSFHAWTPPILWRAREARSLLFNHEKCTREGICFW